MQARLAWGMDGTFNSRSAVVNLAWEGCALYEPSCVFMQVNLLQHIAKSAILKKMWSKPLLHVRSLEGLSKMPSIYGKYPFNTIFLIVRINVPCALQQRQPYKAPCWPLFARCIHPWSMSDAFCYWVDCMKWEYTWFTSLQPLIQ